MSNDRRERSKPVATWLAVPGRSLLGAMVAVGMLAAIVYGLTPAERWRVRFGEPGAGTGWATVIGVVVALAVGATATMATIAYTAQRYFELRAP